MSDRCQDCEHYVHFMVVPLEPADLKGEPWRIGVEWANSEEGDFDITCGVLFRREKKLLSRQPEIGAIEFGPYTQQPTGCEAAGGLSANFDPPRKSANVTAIQMEPVIEAQFYVVVDKSPVPEYAIELKIALERYRLPSAFIGSYDLSSVKVSHRAPVVALHYVTREIGGDGVTTNTTYPISLDRFTSRQELSRSMSSWHDFDWEARRRQPHLA